jgi:putative membrane protein
MFVRQMALHIAVMSLAAPLASLALRPTAFARRSGDALVLATVVQIAALYAWHLPAAQAAAAGSMALMALMHGSLAIAAAWFWLAVLARREMPAAWRAVTALLVTGKLFCLLGILLVLARRPLFGDLAGLGEQQLAGLLMLGACPIVYLGSAFVLTCRGIPQCARGLSRP